MVSGSTVRAKNFVKDFGAGLKNIVGGELKSYTELLEEARREALDRMQQQAQKLGANAILASSVAIAKASALAKHVPLYRSLYPSTSYKVPNIIATVIAGGAFSICPSALEFEDYLYILSDF